MKTGLVLTGGGARAAYQVGAVQAIYEIVGKKEKLFDIISGNSAGGINATYYASHAENWNIATKNLSELWQRITPDNVFDIRVRTISELGMKWIGSTVFGGFATQGGQMNYLLDTAPLRNLIRRESDFSHIQRNINAGLLDGISLSTTNYSTGSSVVFFQGRETLPGWARSDRFSVQTELNENHLMASAAIPFFFPPIQIGESWYGDGCIRQTTPLSPAIHLGSNRLVAIGVRYPHPKDQMKEAAFRPAPNPTLGQITGTILNSIFLDSVESDVERLTRINQLSQSHSTELKNIPVLLLRPSRDLGSMAINLSEKLPPLLRHLLKGIGVSQNAGSDLMSYLAFDKAYTGPLIELGYEDTLKRKEEVKKFFDKN